jgi:hypothetical protein
MAVDDLCNHVGEVGVGIEIDEFAGFALSPANWIVFG